MMDLDGLDKNVQFGSYFKHTETSLTKDIVFLNHGSYGTVPKRVAAAQTRYREEMERNPDLWFRQASLDHWLKAVSVLADFFHCHSQDLVLVPNASTGINSVLMSCKLKTGEAILITRLTYGSIQKATSHVTKRFEGTEAVFLDITFPISSAQQIVDLYEECFKSHPNIKLAVIDYITSPSSVVMPVKELITLCHHYSVLSVIDGAHTPGHIPLHLNDLDADFFTGNLHKWLYAPRGCAILWVKRDHHDWIYPVVTSWGYEFPLQIRFFKQGTRDHTAEICGMHAVQFYQAIGGMDRILKYTTGLINEAQEYLVKLLNTESLPIPKSMEVPNMRCILLSGICGFPQSVVFDESEKLILDIMNKSNIVCAFICIEEKLFLRISANVYNTMDDYRRLGEVLLHYHTA
ncbi:probable L-cysteine desulfhydrase, chloroplastic [Gigantopelta aegis]|uniref:probable L-cysteine desulfhydrase, chloroplastic n=1 Tax=Gigantopelta aegis TaxID=1735272 RepID=UPI001B88A4C4|nr:probable L-cysteine desulfhydrase, chloroplastic [Gigantopelta aegis]